jgi:hypothetical protein
MLRRNLIATCVAVAGLAAGITAITGTAGADVRAVRIGVQGATWAT